MLGLPWASDEFNRISSAAGLPQLRIPPSTKKEKGKKKHMELATEAMTPQTCVHIIQGEFSLENFRRFDSRWRKTSGVASPWWLPYVCFDAFTALFPQPCISESICVPHFLADSTEELNNFPSIGREGTIKTTEKPAPKEMWQSLGIGDLVLVCNSQL